MFEYFDSWAETEYVFCFAQIVLYIGGGPILKSNKKHEA